MKDCSKRLSEAGAIVEECGAIALRFFQERDMLQLKTKMPNDFVSMADVEVEKELRARLNDAYPGEAVVGEELGGQVGDSFWVADPIDGTANFLRGSPLWGVCLAYVCRGEPTVGAISYPALGVTLAAETGQGMFRNGERYSRSVPFPDVRVVAVGENIHWRPTETAMLEHHFRRTGWGVAGYRCSSVGLGFSALGHVDGYFEKQTSLWDFAAGVVICREAGLRANFGGQMEPSSMWVSVGTASVFEAADYLWNQLLS